MDANFDTIVIGGGASGMFAAGRAGEHGSCLLVEKNSRLGVKLGLTGNGRCNVTNSADPDDFIKAYGRNGRFLYRALSEFSNRDLIAFLEEAGVKTSAEEGGKVFPENGDAGSVIAALEKYLKKNKVSVKYNSRAVRLVVSGGNAAGVELKDTGEIIVAGRVIIATGGLSYPETGSTGDGYRMAEEAGHRIVAPKAALVPLESAESFITKLQGVSLEGVAAAVFAGKKKMASGLGDMIFTHFGVSGPLIMNLSGAVSAYAQGEGKLTLSIDLKPGLPGEKLDAVLQEEFRAKGLKTIGGTMRAFLPGRLALLVVELAGVPVEKKCSGITREERKKIAELMKDFRLGVTGTRPIAEATVTAGGVRLDEINPYTMESKIVRGLFFCGEVIDIDGITGGYNLQAAFSTAYLAGGKNYETGG
jgi:predicted Rossmann fold flavoprotein